MTNSRTADGRGSCNDFVLKRQGRAMRRPPIRDARRLKVSDRKRRELESLLLGRLLNDALEAQKIGLRPRTFRMMLTDIGPVQTRVRLITLNTVPDGFLILLERDRLDLTAEAAILAGP
jgi:hypothetical protein